MDEGTKNDGSTRKAGLGVNDIIKDLTNAKIVPFSAFAHRIISSYTQ